jgi:hypothetical protein
MKYRSPSFSAAWIARVGGVAMLALVALIALSATALANPLILNEYNAVAADRYLDGNDYHDALDPIKEDSYFKTIPGMPDGRIQGNGGNWLELVVVEDHLDIRGWQLRWAETGASNTDGTDIWYGNASVEQGIITFSEVTAWSDLRAGTIITLSEKEDIGVDTDWNGLDRNFTDGVDPNDVDVTIDLSTDLSFAPYSGDWWIHVSTRGEQEQATPLVTTVTNVNGDGPGDFSVGPDNWQLRIVDDAKGVVFGPVGEAISGWGGGGLSSKEAGRLEVSREDDPWDLNDWQIATTADYLAAYDDSTSTSFGQVNEWGGLNQDLSALRAQIPEPGTLVLLLSGGLALLLMIWRRRSRAA